MRAMRKIKLEKDFVIVRDNPTVGEVMYYRTGDIAHLLSSYIIDWSSEVPITPESVMNLEASALQKIKKVFRKSLVHPVMTQLTEEDIVGVSKMFFANIQPGDELEEQMIILQPWLEKFMMLIDHNGYLQNYPCDGGLDTQPYSEMQLYKLFQSAFWTVLERKMKQHD